LVAVGARVLDGRTGRFLQRDPTMDLASSTTAHPYAFAWDNPVDFTDPTGAEPVGTGSGGVAAGLAAIGNALYHAPGTPGENIDPYIETRWECGPDHDCQSVVESTYGLTEFEKGLRAKYDRAPRESRECDPSGCYQSAGYNLILDRTSGGLLGYAVFQNTIDIFDRNGHLLLQIPHEAGVRPSWLQPADLIAGPVSSLIGKAIASVTIRSAATAVEDAIADDAASEGVAALTRQSRQPWKYDPQLTKGWGYTTSEGDIFIHSALTPGTAKFEEVLAHESVHRALTARSGPLASLRRNATDWFYENSHLLKYSEEALAQGIATGSPLKGLVFPFTHGYEINPLRLVLEGAAYGGGLYGSYRLGQDLRGEWDSR